jgi:hypothetical protein
MRIEIELFRWRLTAEECELQQDFNLAAVALHEIGHVLVSSFIQMPGIMHFLCSGMM